MLKKIIPYTFLIIFLYNTMGYYVVYKILSYDLKREFQSEMKASLKEKDCTIITLSKTEIDNYLVDDKQELYFNDCYYDIVKIKEQDDLLIVYCLDDQKEDSLFEMYCNHIKNDYSGNSHGKQPIKSAKKVAGGLVKIIYSEISLLFVSSSPVQELKTLYIESIYQHPLKNRFLPPKLA